MAEALVSNFLYSNYEIKIIIITNVLKMLFNRKLLNNINDNRFNLDSIYHEIKENSFYEIKLDTADRNGFNKYKIFILDETIDRLTTGTTIYKMIEKYKNEHLIFIVNGINKNAELHIINDMSEIEVFTQMYFMLNIIEFKYTPQHILLSEEEKNKLIEEYNIPLIKFLHIFTYDPIVKYYNGRLHDVFKIIRPSPVSGVTVSYRYVTKGIIKKD